MSERISGGRKLRIKAACAKGGFSRRTAYRLIAAGKLTARKLGHITLLDEDELDQLLASLPAADITSTA
jgi:excisionase family DNA binding protein